MKSCILVLLAAAVSAVLFAGAQAQDASREDAIIAYLKGVYLESENDLYNAYQYYLYASARDPDDVRILLRLAKVAVEVGDLDAAKKHCEALLAKGAYGTDARLILAEVEYRLGNKEQAVTLLTALRDSTDVSRFQVLKFLAKIDLELNKPEEARLILEEASGSPDADFYVFYELALLDADAGKKQEALEAIGKALEINPDFANAHLARARLLADSGKTTEAKEEYGEVLHIEPANRDAISGLADILYAGGEFAAGTELLAPLHRSGSLDDAGEIAYGRFLYKAGQTDSALVVFNGLLQKMGDKPPLLRVVSEMEISQGRFNTAYRHLKRLVELEPDRFENYIGLLLMFYHVAAGPSSPEEALAVPDEERQAWLDKAASLVAADSEANNYVFGSILRKAGENAKAERFLLRAEAIDARNESVALELATLYGHTGRFDEALKRVVPLYNRNPGDASLANFYGYLLAEKGDSLDRAELLVGSALAKDPQNGYFLDSLGWIKFKKARFREALDLLLKAADKVSNDAVIWEHIGDTYLKLDQSGKARDAYLKSLAIDPHEKRVDDKARKLDSGG